MTTSVPSPYTGCRFPPEIISHSVWLYFRFPLSLRMSRRCSPPAASPSATRPWNLHWIAHQSSGLSQAGRTSRCPHHGDPRALSGPFGEGKRLSASTTATPRRLPRLTVAARRVRCAPARRLGIVRRRKRLPCSWLMRESRDHQFIPSFCPCIGPALNPWSLSIL